jgi:putative transcriptional regulator
MQNNSKVLRVVNLQQELAGYKIKVSRQTINAMEKGKYVPQQY